MKKQKSNNLEHPSEYVFLYFKVAQLQYYKNKLWQNGNG